jgi:arylsulfatase A-like enzyme/Flp pilus assembly protein TadD
MLTSMLFGRPYISVLTAGIAMAIVPLHAVSNPRLNVVVITIDTLRADHVGCYGYNDVKTPNIDRLAANGARFERAYTPVPVTLPAHTAIFTGAYPMLSGIHDFSGNKISPQQITLASVLRKHGYTTGAVIASAVLGSRFGLNQGFDFYYDHFDFSRLDESNLYQMERPGNVVADQALEWLGKNYRKRFFLWMHLYDPHHPYTPPAPYDREYASHPYDGEIAFADAQVGRLIEFLQKKGLYQNTVIVLSGDHGESLGEHGERTHSFFIYNATLHVPLIFRVPRAQAQKVLSMPVSLVDIMPTLLHILGIDLPSTVQGENLLPYINGHVSGNDGGQRSLYAENFLPRIHFNWSELRGIETTHYHFIDAPKPELYDLRKDPGETQNLILEKTAVADEMRARLATVIRDYSASQELAKKTGLDPELMQRLESLGYAGFSGGGDISVSSGSLPDPKDRLQIYNLISDAMSESQHGVYEDSILKLNEVIKNEPGSVPAYYLQGLNYYHLKDWPNAVEEFRHVLKLAPDYALASYNLGLAYLRSDQMDEAIATLKRTLDLDPTNFAAAYNLGAAYLRKEMIPEALAAFRQSDAITQTYAPNHLGLGKVLLYQGQVDEAIEQLQKAAELAPQNPATHAALARAYAAKGRKIEAEHEMRKAQQGPPQ